jgi:hypothetical protein
VADYENTSDATEEPDYLVHLESDADVGVLQSKEWFECLMICHHRFWRALPLLFRIQPQVSFKDNLDKTTYRNVSVSGDIFVRNQQGQQYVCAGELVALQTMTNVLNYLKVSKDRFCKSKYQFLFQSFPLFLTMITVG